MNPKLFVSYSWTSEEHAKWVIDLATALRESGVDVILDKWELREGHDTYAFMEKMVTDSDVKKVILICDKVYAEKADHRTGGVGTETQIISPEIYSKQDQEKFVAVLSERDEMGKPYLPIYYKSRKYIDLSNSEQYTINFEQLLRWIYDKPFYVKPELGQRPSFLDEPGSINIGTTSIFRRAIDALKNSRPATLPILRDYFNTFIKGLEKFRITEWKNEADETIVENIDKFTPYRNEIIELFSTIALYSKQKEVWALITRFFEDQIPFLYSPEGSRDIRDIEYDNFKFIIQEMYLYLIAIFLKYESFEPVTLFLRTPYLIKNLNFARNGTVSFSIFSQYLQSLHSRNSRLKQRLLSPDATFLKQRSQSTGIKFEEIMQADFLLFMRDTIDSTKGKPRWRWYPNTLVYAGYRENAFEIFARAEEVEYFNTIMPMLDIKRKEDLASVLEGMQTGKLYVPRWEHYFIEPASLLGYSRLATR